MRTDTTRSGPDPEPTTERPATEPPGGFGALRFALPLALALFLVVFLLVYRSAQPTRMPGALPAGVVSDAAPGASESLLALSSDEATLAAGADVFRTTCAACHGAVGEGRVGPALTDSTWIHGSDPAAILRGVREGYVARGMPAWEPILGAERTRQAAAFVVSLARSAPEPAATAAPRD